MNHGRNEYAKPAEIFGQGDEVLVRMNGATGSHTDATNKTHSDAHNYTHLALKSVNDCQNRSGRLLGFPWKR